MTVVAIREGVALRDGKEGPMDIIRRARVAVEHMNRPCPSATSLTALGGAEWIKGNLVWRDLRALHGWRCTLTGIGTDKTFRLVSSRSLCCQEHRDAIAAVGSLSPFWQWYARWTMPKLDRRMEEGSVWSK